LIDPESVGNSSNVKKLRAEKLEFFNNVRRMQAGLKRTSRRHEYNVAIIQNGTLLSIFERQARVPAVGEQGS
jgi:hypothetical protein